MPTEPVIEHCPDCGGPLDQVPGICRWCGQHVTLRPLTDAVRDEDEGDVADEVHKDIGVGVDVDECKLPVPAKWILSELSWLTNDRAIRSFLEGQPGLLELARRLTAAMRIAGERIQDAGFEDDVYIAGKADELYSADEMWAFDLGIDLIAWLAAVDGASEDMQRQAGTGIWGHDIGWSDRYKMPLKKAGDGPADLRELRATVPRRGRYDGQGRKLLDLAEQSDAQSPRPHWHNLARRHMNRD